MIKYLSLNGYKSISTEELYKWYIGEVEYNKKTILITIDEGYYEDYYLAYPIIKKYNFKVTSFVVGSRIKDKTFPYNKYIKQYVGMDVINKLRREYPNFEIQSHSFNMHYYTRKNSSKLMCRIKTMSYEDLENDTLKNKKYNFTTMAYPYGVFNEDLKRILKNHGYLVAFRFGPANYTTRNADRYALPRIKLNSSATIKYLKMWLENI